MRIVAWNSNRALHRKIDALMTLRPDVAVISEAAKPERLVAHVPELADASLVWVGKYYVFMPEEWADRAFTLMVGRYQDWIEPRRSDHVPLVLEITTPP